jgi:hypothetical protein
MQQAPSCAGARRSAAPRTLRHAPLRHSAPRPRTSPPQRRALTPPLRVVNEAYEARVDPAQLAVLASTFGLGAYWWFVVVPSERQALAKAKRTGAVREYIEELASSQDASRAAERACPRLLARAFLCATRHRLHRADALSVSVLTSTGWFYSDWLNASWFVKASAKRKARDVAAGASASAASVPLDAAAPPTPDAQEAEPAYTDSQPRFWSLDNPLVATGAALGGMVLLASLTR